MSKYNILIVDDSSVARMVAKSIIEKLDSDITVIEASNAEDALSAICDNNIRAILMDNGMPDRLGIDIAAEIRETNPDIMITMMTANIQEAMKKQAKAIGAGFIEKPPTEDKMQTFIDSIGI